MIPEQLRKGGFRFIKIRKGEKAPFENDWVNGANYDDQEIEKWIERGNNYGVLCNGDLVVVDTDTAEMEKKLSKVLPATFTIKTSKGFHRYYFCSGFPSRRVPGLDIQSNGKQVVAPGSVHPSGAIYEVVKDLPIQRLSKRELLDIVSEFGIKETNGAVDIDELIKPQTSGNRNDATFKLACFYRKAGWSLARVLEGVREWNKINKPPLPDREIKTIVESAFKGEQYSIYFKQNPLTYGEKQKTGDIPNALPTINVGELLKQEIPEQKWVIEPLIRSVGVSVLGGKRSSWKTFGALDASFSVASGTPFLGKYETEKGKVIYINSENDLPILLTRLHLFKHRLGEGDEENIEFLNFSAFKFDEAKWVELLEKRLEKGDVKLIIVDPFAGCHKLDENEAGAMRTIMTDVLGTLANKYSIAFLLIHHLRKGTKETDKLDSLRGSSEFGNFVSSVIIFERNRQIREMFTLYHEKGRGGEEEKPANFTTKENNGNFFFEFIDYRGETIKEGEKCLAEIIEEFEGKDKFSRADVADRLEFKGKTISRALKLGLEKQWLKRPSGVAQKWYVVATGTIGQLGLEPSSPKNQFTSNRSGGVPSPLKGEEQPPLKSKLGQWDNTIYRQDHCPSFFLDYLTPGVCYDVATISLDLKVSEKDVERSLKEMEKSGEVAEVSPGMYRRRENG